MKKPKKPAPPSVQFAKLAGDYAALSRLGRAGAMRKKEIAAKDREREEQKQERERKRKERQMLFYSAQMTRQAHEDICPLH